MKTPRWWFLSLLALLSLIGASCTAPEAKQDTPRPADTAAQPAVATKAPAASSTQPPAPTRAPTVTLIPEDTLEPTLTPIRGTATPTLSPDQVIAPKDGMVLVKVPEGEFIMGSDEIETDGPAHKVWLDTFWIDQTEVTLSMYAQCMQAGACTRPHELKEAYVNDRALAKFPVTTVDYDQASAYCAWAGRRLPTSAEWEKAARGTDGRTYPWGNQAPDPTLANYEPDDQTKTRLKAVGSCPAGASPYGVLDMSGNVYEFVSDWYSSYVEFPDAYKNPKGPASGALRVVRGGSYKQVQLLDLTTFVRQWEEDFGLDVGFRCAVSEKP